MKRPSPDIKDVPSILVGASGVSFVAAELSRRGYVASVTLRNTRGIDILVSNANVTHSVGIQVKTNRGGKKNWMLDPKADHDKSKSLFYVFVNLNGVDQHPDYHIVPSAVVARYVSKNHQNWLAVKPRGASTVRKFKDSTNRYRDRWDKLGL